MTRYILHTPTGRYLKAKDCWTRNRNEALCFDDIFSAVRFCVQQELDDTELLIHFEDGENFDIHLPNWRGRNPLLARA
jgi:hypothetical protein